MKEKVFVIMVEHVPSGVVSVSTEGYKTIGGARQFLTDERNCVLYAEYPNFETDDPSKFKLSDEGWFGVFWNKSIEDIEQYDEPLYVYTIKEVSIK